MQKQTWAAVQVTMQTIYSSHGEAYTRGWNEEVKEVYRRALAHLDDELVAPALERAVRLSSEGWPPSVGQILQCALEYASPVPDVDTAWADAFARCRKANPAPPLHRLVDDAADAMASEVEGGLTLIWHEYRYMGTAVGILRKRYGEAYERLSTLWYQSVDLELRKPGVSRNPLLFPVEPGTLFPRPWDADRVPDVPLLEPPLERNGVSLSPEMRRQLQERGFLLEGIVKSFPE